MRRSIFIILIIGMSLGIQIPVGANSVPTSVEVMLMQNVTSAIRQAQARFDSGNVSGAADLVKKILEKYPDNAEAKALLEKCRKQELTDYENAMDSMEIAELDAFNKKYPSSSYADKVNAMKEDLPLWLDAKTGNSVDSYSKYLETTNRNIFKSEAETAIGDLKAEAAYQVALKENTIKAYEKFRSDYPGSKRDNDASNKIARLMADNFNSRSTYEDQRAALAYAQNEMTRDYVRNKYDKARSSSYSSMSSSSYYSYNQRNMTTVNEDVQERKFAVGLSGSFDCSPYGDSLNSTSWGLGVEFRMGKFNSLFNVMTGAKINRSHYKYSYSEYIPDSSYYYDVEGEGNATQIQFPVILNWNCYRDSFMTFYLGTGYQYGLPIDKSGFGVNAQSFIVQSGMGFRHFDMRIYYVGYVNSLFEDFRAKNPFIGCSMTYYF